MAEAPSVTGPGPDDLLHPVQDQPSGEPSSDSVFCDNHAGQLDHIGEVQLPRPIPVEIVIEVDGFDYTYKLDRREKSA